MKPSLGKLLVLMRNMVQSKMFHTFCCPEHIRIYLREQVKHLISNLIGFTHIFDHEMTH